jgi:hypothetical protein
MIVKTISKKIGRNIINVGNMFVILGEFKSTLEMILQLDQLENLILGNYDFQNFRINYTMVGGRQVTKQYKRHQVGHEAPRITVEAGAR